MESYVTCPFNKSHRILKARFQTHLLKCRKNYPQNKKVVCPFDATHMLDAEEYDHHLSICPTSGNIKCYQTVLEPIQKVGAIALEKACQLQTVKMDEDWSGNNPTYDPLAASENKNIIRTTTGLSKSKRKQFKQQERDRISVLENIGCVNHVKNQNIQKTTHFEQSLRAPMSVANALTYDNDNSTTLTNELIMKLKNVSMEENNSSLTDSTLTKKNFTVNNTSKDTSSSENSVTCNITDSCSSYSTNDSEQESDNNTSKKGNTTTAKHKNISTIYEKSGEEEDVSTVNKTIIQGNCKHIDVQNDVLQDSFDPQINLESQKSSAFNLGMVAANSYGEAKKISTGRGFTIAYKNLNNTHSKPGAEKKNSLNLTAVDRYYDD